MGTPHHHRRSAGGGGIQFVQKSSVGIREGQRGGSMGSHGRFTRAVPGAKKKQSVFQTGRSVGGRKDKKTCSKRLLIQKTVLLDLKN